MRRSIIIAGLAILLAVAVAPRANAGGYAGFRGGVNLASFSGGGQFAPYGAVSPNDDYPKSAFPSMEYPDTRTGFTGAVFIGLDKGRLGFRTDIMYTMKGAKNGEASIKIDYVEVAPLFVFRQPVSSSYAVRVFAGPVFGVFVNAEADNGPIDVDLGDIVEHVEVSGTLGAELDIKAGPYWLVFDARYTQGTSVFEGQNLEGDDLLYGTANPTKFEVTNTGIAVTAGLMIPF